MAEHLLIVEDDTGLREGLCETFLNLGYSVQSCERGDVVIDEISQKRPDLMLLDLMLPGEHGIDICKKLRADGVMLPIIMLTAMADEDQVIDGLKVGADDYITKPFRLKELIARVEAQLRRAQGSFGDTINLPDRKVALSRGEIEQDGVITNLTQLELEVLKYLVRSRPNPVSRSELLSEVWGYKDAITTRTVDMAIAKLRNKLEANASKPQVIVTVRDQGYKLELTQTGAA